MFDSDSFIIGVDNLASRRIYNQRYNFITNFYPLPHRHTQGIGGQISIKGKVTIRWKIEDDEDRVHTLYIKYALYVAKSPLFVLFPQH